MITYICTKQLPGCSQWNWFKASSRWIGSPNPQNPVYQTSFAFTLCKTQISLCHSAWTSSTLITRRVGSKPVALNKFQCECTKPVSNCFEISLAHTWEYPVCMIMDKKSANWYEYTFICQVSVCSSGWSGLCPVHFWWVVRGQYKCLLVIHMQWKVWE